MSRTATPQDVLEGRARWCVIEGDCREVLPTLPQVDAVVTDPPYGVNLGSHGGAADGRPGHVLVKGAYVSYEDTPENFDAVVVPAIRTSIAGAKRAAVFCSGSMAWRLPAPDQIGGVFLPSACGRTNWGFNSFAHCLFYGRAPDLHLGSKPTGISSTESAEKTAAHPCPKPLGWMVWVVGLVSRAEEVVLDPFAGSGTTGVACLRLGRRVILIEREPAYAEVCRERLEAEAQGLTLRDARAGQLSLLELTKEARNGAA